MKNPKPITLKLSDAQLVLLARGMVQAGFDMVVNGKSPAPIPVALPAAASFSLSSLPPIGHPLENGTYAGITIHDNVPMALILLPGDEEMKWEDGVKWAEKQGGVLPS